jgi:hypothetical protein
VKVMAAHGMNPFRRPDAALRLSFPVICLVHRCLLGC